MNTKAIFEAFNHFLATGDSGEILSVSDNLEVFTSATFSDGQTRIGSEAPEKFREMIFQITRSHKPVSVKLEHATIQDDNAIFFMNVNQGRKTTGSALNLLISDGQLKCFHETKSNL